LNLSRLLFVVVSCFLALFGSDKIAGHFSLSGFETNAVTTALVLPIILVWLYLSYRSSFVPSKKLWNVSPATWVLRFLGLAFLLLGAFLFIGNHTGAFSTFPMAGSISLVAGALILGFFGRGKI
jgi:hypothetical protein